MKLPPPVATGYRDTRVYVVSSLVSAGLGAEAKFEFVWPAPPEDPRNCAVLSIPCVTKTSLVRYPEQVTWIDEHLGSAAGLERTWDTEWHLTSVDAAAAVEAEFASCGWLIRRAVALGLTGDSQHLLDIDRGDAAQRILHFVFREAAGREPTSSASLDLVTGPNLAVPAVYFKRSTLPTRNVPRWLARHLTARRGTPPGLDGARLRLADPIQPVGLVPTISPARSSADVSSLVDGSYMRRPNVDGVISDALSNGGALLPVVLNWDLPAR
jgi:hypothetical protein